MSSINFNSAATQALRTLQTSNTALDATQKRIATGLAIGEAKDNAAYWSISTTMQSDNKALGTVTDALGLGAATVDTAYQGLSAAKDVLNEIKSKLTAALGSNVDRSAIQSEIDSLQEQLKSIASSSTFSGENWLSVNSSLSTYSANKTVVSSFTRDVAGNVTVGEIKFDSSTAVLFDATSSTTSNKGVLDSTTALTAKVNGVETALTFGGTGASGNVSAAGLKSVATSDANYTAGTGTGAGASQVFSGTWAAGNYKIGDTVSFTASLDGGVTNENVSLVITSANKANAGAFRTALLGAINQNANLNGKLTVTGTGDVTINTAAQGTDAKLRIGTISAANGATSALGLSNVGPSVAGDGTTTKTTYSLGALSLTGAAEGDTITITGAYNGGTTRTAAVVLSAGMLAPADNFATFAAAVTTALQASGGANTDLEAAVVGGNLVLRSTVASALAISGVTVATSNTDTVAGSLAGVTTAGTAGADIVGTGTKASVKFDDFKAVQLDGDDTLSLAFAATNFTVNKAAISSALGTTDGKIASVDQFVTVLNSLPSTNFVASKNADGKLVLSSRAAGTSASAVVSGVVAGKGSTAGGAGISVSDIDVSDATLNSLGATDAEKRVQAITAYINVVNSAINKVTAAATSIGAVGKRIDLQQTFVQNLMDTIDKGVSGLIDADMNEESTKLQALQVKQQLGVQALSIANQSAQNVLRLFQ